MEYLLAAKPVVMHRLDGVPQEYDPYLIYTTDNSVTALASALTQVIELSQDDRLKLGARGRDFVLKNKNAKKQTGRIVNLLLA